jgi:hypothetical protein
MPRFDVAHLREQGQDMIIIPLDSDFGLKSNADQSSITNELQRHANGAGLRGTVVPVWDNGGGRMAFIAPRPWHPFFRSISLGMVAANINQEIYW